jgi:hypothetical protein
VIGPAVSLFIAAVVIVILLPVIAILVCILH